MTALELEDQVRKLEFLFGKSKPSQRVELRPGIERIIRTLRSTNQTVPARLRAMEAELIDEDEDFFENMPV